MKKVSLLLVTFAPIVIMPCSAKNCDGVSGTEDNFLPLSNSLGSAGGKPFASTKVIYFVNH